jgi:hypothetical protein
MSADVEALKRLCEAAQSLDPGERRLAAYKVVPMLPTLISELSAAREVVEAARKWQTAYGERWTYAFGRRAAETTELFRLAEMKLTQALARYEAVAK